ncbi:manganese-binding transcriptional regulator MntR [Stieleria varia]|uniref:manganese-binding transcriptional regulator MntR n=1 Tax=Stieleria varia TaxID=2528005 RepID=UPI001E6226C4|nr:manganese-binding transcriptional regulator MntR [Stieleria varia]
MAAEKSRSGASPTQAGSPAKNPARNSGGNNPYLRTRRDHASETAEDYVEAIDDVLREREVCRASDLAKCFAVSHVTVHRIVARLKDEGLLETEPYRPITLTAKGKRLAKKARERHELVYEFLLAIGVAPATAAVDAEGIEHHVSSETLDRLAAVLPTLSET